MSRRLSEESSGGKPEIESVTKSSTDWMIFRILIFYIFGVLITGMLVPYNDDHLLKTTGNAAQSPYVIAMEIAGIKGLPHLVNAGVFTSAFSAGNSFLYTSSRVLYGLALRGQGPRILIKCTKGGLPWVAVVVCSCFGLLAFLNVSASSAEAFNWLVSLSAVGSFFSWFSINLTYLGFCEWSLVSLRFSAVLIRFLDNGLKAQGIDRSTFIYSNSLQPYLSMWGVFWTALFILINGFPVFWKFTAAGFLTSYINVPIFAGSSYAALPCCVLRLTNPHSPLFRLQVLQEDQDLEGY